MVKHKKMYTGVVVSDKMQKTVVAAVTRAFKHEKFQKIVRTVKKYKVHDEQGLAKLGNTIEFYEGAPKSKTKYMYVHRIVS
ncbi:30S ribosomal protein S17 [Candidatus Babeliales bacterium]|nr:30S ribosomal protein S17 [Candidatus Babeliales bacterium]